MPPAEGSKSSGCLKGCLIVVVILILLAVVGAIVLYFSWRPLAARFVSAGFNNAIDSSQLPLQEKAEVKAEVDRAIQSFRNNTMSNEQFGQLMQGLVESPLMTAIVVTGVEQKYLDPSGLSEEEKAAGRKDIRRFWRGMIDGKIPQATFDAAMAHVADKNAGGNWKMREQVTDQDLRDFLSKAKAAADAAQIPAEPENIDVSDEVKRIVDRALGAQ
jgi:hypothetical protein